MIDDAFLVSVDDVLARDSGMGGLDDDENVE
jgi:hypothetical protein